MTWTDPRTWVDGELVTASLLNTHLRDNLNAIGPVVKIRKTADESVTSSTTLQNDNDFVFPVAANEVWLAHYYLFYTGDPAGDFKWGWTGPAGMTGSQGVLGITFSATDGDEDLVNFTANNAPFPGGTRAGARLGGIGYSLHTWLVAVNAGTPGDLQLTWAQDASNATATILRANSVMIAQRLSP